VCLRCLGGSRRDYGFWFWDGPPDSRFWRPSIGCCLCGSTVFGN
jgi:hypothetical protein